MHIVIAALHRPIKPTGVCRHAANLARCLAEQSQVSHISVIIGSWQQHYFESVFDLDSPKIKLEVVELKNSSLSRNLWFLSGLPRLVSQLAPDLVHLSFPFPFWRSPFKVPIVTTIHDLYPYECPENFGFPQVWFNQLFLQQAIHNSDGLPCVSQITQDKLHQYFPRLKPRQQVEVVYNFVDFAGLQTQTPGALDNSSKFLLTVAQHRQNKNLDLLITAYANLREQQRLAADCQLIIVGTTGPETPNLQELIARFQLENLVHLWSAINDPELGWLYEHCQAFVIPSSTEGFCLPLAEALHFSDRVVCSDIPIFREIGSEASTYFTLDEAAILNLCQAIEQTLARTNSPGHDEAKRFDKNAIAQKYLSLYQKTMSS